MAYSDFTLTSITKAFDLTIHDQIYMFVDVAEVPISPLLQETLQENVPLALASNTEKSRSEMIISPILIELRKQLNHQISLFSGVDFTVDPAQGLNGNCDYIISRSAELLLLRTPVVMLVEAKKENLNAGLGQCIAEMLAARIYNEREQTQPMNQSEPIFGVVTSGTNWKFLKLQEQLISIDLDEYYLSNIGKILGILLNCITETFAISSS
jgi:hypothetical protein